jgi:hypothetical protein
MNNKLTVPCEPVMPAFDVRMHSTKSVAAGHGRVALFANSRLPTPIIFH